MTKHHCGIVHPNVPLILMRCVFIKGRLTFSVLSVSTMVAGSHLIVLTITRPPMPRKVEAAFKQCNPDAYRKYLKQKAAPLHAQPPTPLDQLQLMWPALLLIWKLNAHTLQSALLTFMSSMTFGSNPPR